MKNCDKSVAISHNPNWIYIPDYPYRLLITGGPRLGKTKVLLNLIKPSIRYQLQVSIIYQRERKSRDSKIKKSKGTH